MAADKEFWDLKAAKYPRPFEKNSLDGALAVLDKLRRAGADFAGRDVLDIGCGTGNYGLLFAGQARRVLCLDFSGEMLAVLRREAAAAGLSNVETELASFPDYEPGPRAGSFDLVFASMTPAVRTPADVEKMERLCRGACVYIGWAGRRESPVSDALLAAHGVKPSTPPGFNNVRDILARRGRGYTAETFEVSWTWQGTVAQGVEEFSARVRLDGKEPDARLLENELLKTFPDGKVSLTTSATEGLLIWRP